MPSIGYSIIVIIDQYYENKHSILLLLSDIASV